MYLFDFVICFAFYIFSNVGWEYIATGVILVDPLALKNFTRYPILAFISKI
jgi:hypothetical protein